MSEQTYAQRPTRAKDVDGAEPVRQSERASEIRAKLNDGSLDDLMADIDDLLSDEAIVDLAVNYRQMNGQ